jgi:hypothetical protein
MNTLYLTIVTAALSFSPSGAATAPADECVFRMFAGNGHSVAADRDKTGTTVTRENNASSQMVTTKPLARRVSLIAERTGDYFVVVLTLCQTGTNDRNSFASLNLWQVICGHLWSRTLTLGQ